MDKLKLKNFSRRPIPTGAKSIGIWFIILDIITFFSLFTNAGLLAYTSGAVEDNKFEIFMIFLVIINNIFYFEYRLFC